MVMRTTTQEVEIGGKTIPSSAQIDMCMGSANRDESRWTDPNTSTFAGHGKPTSRSPAVSTCAWACIWPGWKRGSC